MSWSDLQPQARVAIAVGMFLVLVLLAWMWFVSPTLASRAAARGDIATAEAQLDQMEREIEGTPQATERERADWQSSSDELMSRLGPEAELPLLIESLIRLAESQGVDIFLSSEAAMPVSGRSGRGVQPSQLQAVLGAVPGASFVPLDCRIYGDYASTSRFISQIGRLGWVTEIAGLVMERSFPEVVSSLRLIVYFRPTERNGGAGALGVSSGGNGSRIGAQGGRGNG